MNDSEFNAALPKLQPFLDGEGRLMQWPASRKIQRIALEYIASHFDFGKEYTEKQVNSLLIRLHTFGDPALLRRELFENGYLNRQTDGSGYWRTRVKMM